MLNDQARALAAAQGMMRLAIAKYRALRSEFYYLETLPAARKADFLRAWLADFDAGAATSPARILRDRLGCEDVGVATFSRLVLVETGAEYHRDILKIVTFGVASGQRRTIEEMIEIRSTDP